MLGSGILARLLAAVCQVFHVFQLFHVFQVFQALHLFHSVSETRDPAREMKHLPDLRHKNSPKALRSYKFARKVGRIHDIGRRRCMKTVQMAVIFSRFLAER